MRAYTSQGWQDVDESEADLGVDCCECSEPATDLLESAPGVFWAVCADDATETRSIWARADQNLPATDQNPSSADENPSP